MAPSPTPVPDTSDLTLPGRAVHDTERALDRHPPPIPYTRSCPSIDDGAPTIPEPDRYLDAWVPADEIERHRRAGITPGIARYLAAHGIIEPLAQRRHVRNHTPANLIRACHTHNITDRLDTITRLHHAGLKARDVPDYARAGVRDPEDLLVLLHAGCTAHHTVNYRLRFPDLSLVDMARLAYYGIDPDAYHDYWHADITCVEQMLYLRDHGIDSTQAATYHDRGWTTLDEMLTARHPSRTPGPSLTDWEPCWVHDPYLIELLDHAGVTPTQARAYIAVWATHDPRTWIALHQTGITSALAAHYANQGLSPREAITTHGA